LAVALVLLCASPGGFGRAAFAATTAPFSASDEPLRSVLPRLAKVYNANLSIPPDAHGSVSVSLQNATLDQALEAVLSPLGYRYRHDSGVIVIYRTVAAQNPATALAPTVIPVSVMSVDRAVAIVHNLYPSVSVRADKNSNAIIVVASPEDAAGIRTVVSQLDVRNPTAPSVDAVTVRTDPAKLAAELRGLYPHSEFEAGPNHSVLIRAPATDMAQIKGLIASLDAPPTGPTAGPVNSNEAVTIVKARPQDVARAVSREIPQVRADVSGSTVILTGSPDNIARAKALIAEIDVSPPNARTTELYRIHTLDATSVGNLLTRSFPTITVTVDHDLNAISVTATGAEQQRIADAVRQLDQPQQPGAGAIVTGPGGGGFEVVTLKSSIPAGAGGGAGGDMSTNVITTLQQLVPGVRVSPLGTPGQYALIGDPVSLRLAKEYLTKLDTQAPLVVLDTEIVEIDESLARNVGLQLSPPEISTTFTEAGSLTGLYGETSSNIGFQPLTRTPASFTAILNLQIQNGNAHVLSDPRITTISGRTASIRAGDTLNILTTTGGGAGTIATTQLQSFQTGVTLDITPLVTTPNDVTVSLHPVVASETAILNGIPQISTRDTQTVVHLKNNETLVIGGLIESNTQKTENKIPVLGDIPLIGGLFRNSQVTSSRNELIIVVTPHLITDEELSSGQGQGPGAKLPAVGAPGALPTLPPETQLPPASGQMPAPPQAAAPTQAPAQSQILAAPAAATPSSHRVGGLVVYGKRPDNNIAGPNDAPVIFYAALGPSTVADRTNISITAITSTNVTNLTASYGTQSISMGQLGNGQWQALFPFTTSAIPVGSPQFQVKLTASRQDGATQSILLPVRLAQ
jgi:type II secretory pathway component GspD/PulD (secretin)